MPRTLTACVYACFLTYCALAIISVITNPQTLFFLSKDKRQMIFVPTNFDFRRRLFPPKPLNGIQNIILFLIAIQKPHWRSSRKAGLCIVFRYGLDHIDCGCGFLLGKKEGEVEKCWIAITRAIYLILLKGIIVTEGHSPFTERLLFLYLKLIQIFVHSLIFLSSLQSLDCICARGKKIK